MDSTPVLPGYPLRNQGKTAFLARIFCPFLTLLSVESNLTVHFLRYTSTSSPLSRQGDPDVCTDFVSALPEHLAAFSAT